MASPGFSVLGAGAGFSVRGAAGAGPPAVSQASAPTRSKQANLRVENQLCSMRLVRMTAAEDPWGFRVVDEIRLFLRWSRRGGAAVANVLMQRCARRSGRGGDLLCGSIARCPSGARRRRGGDRLHGPRRGPRGPFGGARALVSAGPDDSLGPRPAGGRADQSVLRAPTRGALLAIDDQQCALDRALARPGLVSSVTRAPRAPPRSRSIQAPVHRHRTRFDGHRGQGNSCATNTSCGLAEAAMEWLNYHHLLYFWLVAREGGLVPAGKILRLSQPTLSGPDQEAGAVAGRTAVRAARAAPGPDRGRAGGVPLRRRDLRHRQRAARRGARPRHRAGHSPHGRRRRRGAQAPGPPRARAGHAPPDPGDAHLPRGSHRAAHGRAGQPRR